MSQARILLLIGLASAIGASAHIASAAPCKTVKACLKVAENQHKTAVEQAAASATAAKRHEILLTAYQLAFLAKTKQVAGGIRIVSVTVADEDRWLADTPGKNAEGLTAYIQTGLEMTSYPAQPEAMYWGKLLCQSASDGAFVAKIPFKHIVILGYPSPSQEKSYGYDFDLITQC